MIDLHSPTHTAYLRRELAKVLSSDRPRRRLELDMEALLAGPTSGANAARLGVAAVSSDGPIALAHAMIEAGKRYLASEGKKST